MSTAHFSSSHDLYSATRTAHFLFGDLASVFIHTCYKDRLPVSYKAAERSFLVTRAHQRRLRASCVRLLRCACPLKLHSHWTNQSSGSDVAPEELEHEFWRSASVTPRLCSPLIIFGKGLRNLSLVITGWFGDLSCGRAQTLQERELLTGQISIM